MERSGYSSVAAAHDRSMKMLDLAPNISKAASAASAISNDEIGAVGDAVILISDKMTSRDSFVGQAQGLFEPSSIGSAHALQRSVPGVERRS